MAEVGMLDPGERVELIDGEIVDLVAIGSEHGGMTSRLARVSYRAVGGAALVDTTSPWRVDRFNEAQPHRMPLRPRADEDLRSHPEPADVRLVVEVAHATLAYGRDVEAALHARAGVVVLRVVDLVNRRLEMDREPRREG